MSKKFTEYSGFDLSAINQEILKKWDAKDLFHKSMAIREGAPSYVFYEGPPSANGMPGIHHVMARSIKDIFCRYKTMKGYQVLRKAGWDTHGLPVELGVEKALGITKEDIGKTISVAEYNAACRKDVMKYTKEWEDLTHQMGYWVNMDDPYITYDSRYIETLWYLLKELYKKGLMYKGYTIQPYSPAAGTGLSSHELNQPGCYRDVKDTTCVAQFKIKNPKAEWNTFGDAYFLAWTTTPWTLPSNTALCVGINIRYSIVRTFNPYTFKPINVIIATDRISSTISYDVEYEQWLNREISDKYKNEQIITDWILRGIIRIDLSEEIVKGFLYEKLENGISYKRSFPYKILGECRGSDLVGIDYEQLIPWVNPGENAFKVLSGDFVTTEEGTGIVHIAPTFGADDDRVAKNFGIAPLLLTDKDGNARPMVDPTGKFYRLEDLDATFVEERMDAALYSPFAGVYVKNAYDDTKTENDSTIDVDLCVMLKQQNLVFKIEKQTHSYPHCWRTDKPVLYYPLDSWFIKSTACRERMMELNETIQWKPTSTGIGRFGKWLENLNDWNLSRSRFWGTPLPIWRTEDGMEEFCIGSVAELHAEIEKSVKFGLMSTNLLGDFQPGVYTKDNYDKIDLHRPYMDDIILVSATGKPMKRETDLIDVWFDSGAMPYAQIHYPFENKEAFDKGENFPADFIAEGVDQTRGWFFTLHAIATMVFDTVSFKNVVSNGLVLDKNGNKMSKRLGNAVDPFSTINKYGSDPLRWYMITNASPWDNLKFDTEGIEEVRRKFFGTLYNTYSFFSLYANVDGFTADQAEIPYEKRPEIDRWVLSQLNSLIKEVDDCYFNYEPTRAGRAISDFVSENLSNWYVRLNRKRFWGGEFTEDKLSAYQTLYTCLETVSRLMAPIAPFYADQLFCDLNAVSGKDTSESVHLADFPKYDETVIDTKLETRMQLAQQISSMVLALRRKVSIKVRQPLTVLMIPAVDVEQKEQIEAVSSLILSEVNVKSLNFVDSTAGILVKRIKPDFKKLGPKCGKQMKQVAALLTELPQDAIAAFEKDGSYALKVDDSQILVETTDVEILSEDIPGWLVANEGRLTVALDITITVALKQEGLARELVNRIQNIRKSNGYEITDKINIQLTENEDVKSIMHDWSTYIMTQTLAGKFELVPTVQDGTALDLEDMDLFINIQKIG